MTKLASIVSIFVFLVSPSLAQIPNRIFLSNDFENPSGRRVHIKWMSDSVFYPGGVDIYRREPGGIWEKITKTPVKAMSSIPADLSKDERIFASLAIDVDYSEFISNDFRRAIILSEAVKSQKLARVLGITFTDENVSDGIQYDYKVEAIATPKRFTIGEATIQVGQFQPIAPPDSFKIERKKKVVTMRWHPDEPRFAFVHIQKSENGTDFTDLTPDPYYLSQIKDSDGNLTYPDIFYEDREIKKDKDYWYRIAAYDYFGQLGSYSEPAAALAIDFDPPSPPVNVKSAKVDSLQMINISWEYPSKTPDLKGFMILSQRSEMDTAQLINENLLAPDTRSYDFIADSPGMYILYVVAVDQAENYSVSDPRPVLLADRQPPMKPQNVTASVDSGRVYLQWKGNAEPDLAGYWVFRGRNKDNQTEFVSVNGSLITSNQYIDTLPKIEKGVFAYRIQAVDTNYNKSKYSEVVLVSLADQNPPGAPVITQVKNEEGKLTLNFLPSPDDDLAFYKLIRRSAEDTLEVTLPMGTDAYEDMTVKPGFAYTYELVAVDESDNESIPSNRYSITAKGQDMSAFEGHLPLKLSVKYVKSKKQVMLTWTQTFSDDILGVIVYKGEKEKELTPITSLMKKPGFSDKRIEPGKKYYYQLRTFAANGAKHISETVSIQIKEEK